MLEDDGLGVDEALNERAFGKGLIARGSTYFVFGAKKTTQQPSTAATERFIQLQTLLPIWPLFSNVSQMSYNTWRNRYNHIVWIIYCNSTSIQAIKDIDYVSFFLFSQYVVLRIEK